MAMAVPYPRMTVPYPRKIFADENVNCDAICEFRHSQRDIVVTVMPLSEAMYFDIQLERPVLQSSSDGYCFFTFGIAIRTNDPSFSLANSFTRRRYSEFCWLRKTLQSNDLYETKMPSLPTRGIFRDRLSPKFLEERRLGLQEFLRQVADTLVFKSDKALHLFLQTGLHTCDIQLNLDGIRRDNVMGNAKITAAASAAIEYAAPGRIPNPSSLPSPSSFNGSTGSESPNQEAGPTVHSWPVMRRVTFCEEVLNIEFNSASPCTSSSYY